VSVGRSALAAAAVLAALGCGKSAPPAEQNGAPAAPPPEQEPPVALNPDSPIQYPPRLYDQKVEGDVVLRLFVDSAGRLAPESCKVAESSGYPALDSAALVGARKLRFAPARRRGTPIATAFLQPIEFRHSGTPRAGGAGRAGGGGGASVISRPDTGKTMTPARPDTARRVRARPDTSTARPDSGVVLPDTGATRVDTNAVKADTNAAPH
jgi:TonB family protein